MPYLPRLAWLAALLVVLCWVGCGPGESTQEPRSPMAPLAVGSPVATQVPLSTDNTAGGGNAALSKACVEFVQGYAKARQQARESGKPMLLFFTAKWCRFCHEMERSALTDRQIVRLAEQFICVQVDADDNAEICKDFAVRSFPTVLFISPDGVAMNRLVGLSRVDELASQMEAAVGAAEARMAAARQAMVH